MPSSTDASTNSMFEDEHENEGALVEEHEGRSTHSDVDMEESTTSFLSRRSKKSSQENTSESSTLVKQETILVQRTKMLVILILCLAACAVGVATYLFTTASEQCDFESKFHDFSVEIADLVHHEARNVQLTVHAFATTVTSYAISTRATWPFVSVPHFEVRGLEMNNLSNSLLMGFSPYVTEDVRFRWELYANYMQTWVQEGVDFNLDLHKDYLNENGTVVVPPIFPQIYKHGVTNTTRVPVDAGVPTVPPNKTYLPVWQMAPAPHDPTVIHYDLLENEVFERVEHGMHGINQAVLSEATDLEWLYGGSIRDDPTHPHSFLLQPVYEGFENLTESAMLGVIVAVIGWDHMFRNLLPPEAHGIIVVMKDTCGDMFSYQIDGADAIFLGHGDHHETKYSHLEESTPFDALHKLEVSETHEHCEYDLHIFPSQELEDDYRTSKPIIYTIVVMSVFFTTVLVFVLYDWLVKLRQEKVMLAAKKSNAVVASLFPKNVRDRIMADVEEQIAAGEKPGKKNPLMFGAVAKHELKHFLDDGIANADGVPFDTKPIADLFPNTTIMFADIVGFTAWSSVREPSQVFSLLETLYHAFDEIAKRRRVFKVETIGDCYVAVAGLPEPRKDHATVMARFARDCLNAINDLTKRLEITLGPDTGDLSMRVGLHSGPVTAGVLRGDKSRFQLFGDTVNTAARMESNGTRNRIHISSETAELLKAGGKFHWLVKRTDKIVAKGKGEMETYWLEMKQQSSGSAHSGRSGRSSSSTQSGNTDVGARVASVGQKAVAAQPIEIDDPVIPAKIKRLVKWNADVLLRILKQVVARREALEQLKLDDSDPTASSEMMNRSMNRSSADVMNRSSADALRSSVRGETVIDEVVEILELPKFNAKAAKIQKDPKQLELDPKVVQQLHDYITVIASMYRVDVPFHNFEHASHVTMSVVKLLSRIVAPDDVLENEKEAHEIHSELHDHTYGITSDPLTQFAVVLSALIHDVDHTGAPNSQLIKEGASIASIYKGKSVAEQNSLDLAWSLLMDDSFVDLRNAIYKTDSELQRFRQLLVNIVLATDIVDKDLKSLRNRRWEKAFQEGGPNLIDLSSQDATNRKATIILEHLIQASDIAHTMQHWHIYRKWNELFFKENLLAYRAGRASSDPCEYWYKGEIGFFDFYIIPLAKKLKECGVFGVSCDEYLNYALTNRKEWADRGEEAVAEMKEKYADLMPEEEKDIHRIEEE
ncbi:Receptor-type guanylate cyclase gcy [Seminavis robusta]|uniref:Receptor-type guanylate cyclase gcy n=1 Tax=Seminavis robusta TaxID=568900 RepID=A0A9N8DBU3_9STRA|nr:Receptor-type guanylate cyclase gcy [Seminavis robusta]|eukprot:Sro76_g041710.1 Receptor-type guanylate cyclase gcy (1222) ;mRNA; r:86605-91280